MSASKTLFFFGTLRHRDILKTVLGRLDGRFRTAFLPDYRVARFGNLDLPLLTPASGERAEGILAEDLSENEIARLDFYEGGFDYELSEVNVDVDGQHVAALAYFSEGAQPDPQNWDFQAWSRAWSDVSLIAAKEAMGHFGRISAQELAWRFPQIRVRAASTVRAQRNPSVDGAFGSEDVDVLSCTRPYDQFFAMDDLVLRHRQFGGGYGPEIKRAVLVSGDAVTVLPYDPVRDRVLVIEQFRAGPLARGDLAPWIIEPVAGRIDPGESPDQTARREALEEAGLELGRLIEIGKYYPSPGVMSEYLFSFVGLCDLPDGTGIIAGLETEAEDIKGHVMSHDAFQAMIAAGGGANGPLILSALWLAQNRDRLRRGD